MGKTSFGRIFLAFSFAVLSRISTCPLSLSSCRVIITSFPVLGAFHCCSQLSKRSRAVSSLALRIITLLSWLKVKGRHLRFPGKEGCSVECCLGR